MAWLGMRLTVAHVKWEHPSTGCWFPDCWFTSRGFCWSNSDDCNLHPVSDAVAVGHFWSLVAASTVRGHSHQPSLRLCSSQPWHTPALPRCKTALLYKLPCCMVPGHKQSADPRSHSAQSYQGCCSYRLSCCTMAARTAAHADCLANALESMT